MKEPSYRIDLRGKYRLVNCGVLTNNMSFDTKKQARAWADWNNFGNDSSDFMEIVENPALVASQKIDK